MNEEPADNHATGGTPRAPSQREPHFHPQRRKRRGGLLFLLGAVVFVAGLVIGNGLTVLYFRSRVYPRPPSSEELTGKILTRMHDVVTLTTEEDEKIRDFIQDRLTEVKNIRQESSDTIRGCFDEMRAGVSTILGPERAKKWNAEVEKDRAERKARRPHHQPPRHH